MQDQSKAREARKAYSTRRVERREQAMYMTMQSKEYQCSEIEGGRRKKTDLATPKVGPFADSQFRLGLLLTGLWLNRKLGSLVTATMNLADDSPAVKT